MNSECSKYKITPIVTAESAILNVYQRKPPAPI